MCKQKKVLTCTDLHGWYTKRIHSKEESDGTSKLLSKYIPRWGDGETKMMLYRDGII
jgi:hypothetical protein